MRIAHRLLLGVVFPMSYARNSTLYPTILFGGHLPIVGSSRLLGYHSSIRRVVGE